MEEAYIFNSKFPATPCYKKCFDHELPESSQERPTCDRRKPIHPSSEGGSDRTASSLAHLDPAVGQGLAAVQTVHPKLVASGLEIRQR